MWTFFVDSLNFFDFFLTVWHKHFYAKLLYFFKAKVHIITLAEFTICDKISLKGPIKKKVNFKINAILKHKTEF